MKFGEIQVATAEGAILAHSVKHRTGMFKKGRVLTGADLAILAESGVAQVFAARLSDDDVPEDKAAEAVAKAIAGEGTVVQAPFPGAFTLAQLRHHPNRTGSTFSMPVISTTGPCAAKS